MNRKITIALLGILSISLLASIPQVAALTSSCPGGVGIERYYPTGIGAYGSDFSVTFENDNADSDATVCNVIDPTSVISTVEFTFDYNQATETGCNTSVCTAEISLCDNSAAANFEPLVCTAAQSYFKFTLKLVSGPKLEITRTATYGTAGTAVVYTDPINGFWLSHEVSITIEHDTKTVTYVVDGGAPVAVIGSGTPSGTGFLYLRSLVDSTTNPAPVLEFTAALTDVLEPPPVPTAPTGISALVVEAQDEPSDTCGVELRWPVSPNDPDSDVGEYDYQIYVNGVFAQNDAVTSADGDGIRFALIELSGVLFDVTDFKVRAENTLTEQTSPFSPTVSVDCSDLNDFAQVGDFAGGGATSSSNFISNMLNFFEVSWGFDGSWIFGIIVIGLCVSGFASIKHAQPFVTIMGAFVGVGLSVILGLLPVWVLFIIIFLIIAVSGAVLFGSNKDPGGDSE